MIYVLQVLTGKEEDVWRELKKRGYKGYVPRQEIPQRRGGAVTLKKVIYFPSYVFLALKELTDADYYTMRKVPYVLHFLPREKPEPVRGEEAAYIRLLSRPQDVTARKETDGTWQINIEELAPYVDKVLHRSGTVRLRLPFQGEKVTALLPCQIIKST